MYTGLLHLHVTLIGLYLIVFLIKLTLLLGNRFETLARFRKKTKVIGEMVLPSLFMITGVVLAAKAPDFTVNQGWFWIKMGAILFSVIAGLITFRRNSKPLGVLTLLVFAYIVIISYRKDPTLAKTGESGVKDIRKEAGTATASIELGSKIYSRATCISCHGEDGTLGAAGAANLQTSRLSDDEIKTILMNGKKNMPKFDYLSDIERESVIQYIKTLRK